MSTMQQQLQSGAALSEKWVCPFCYTTGCTTPGACKELALRNHVLDEVAAEFDKMTSLGDTAASFAVFVRDMKR